VKEKAPYGTLPHMGIASCRHEKYKETVSHYLLIILIKPLEDDDFEIDT